MKYKVISVDHYIESFDLETQPILKNIRAIVREIAPIAQESISYGMPAYKINGKPLVYFAGFKNHIGFYALPSGHLEFKKQLAKYKQGKGSVQFPLKEPIPYELIKDIVRFRLKENLIKS